MEACHKKNCKSNWEWNLWQTFKIYKVSEKYMMDPILDDAIYALMSKYDLEQLEGAKSVFNGFI